MKARGTFEIKMNAEPPIDVVDGVTLGRFTIDKQFKGPLEGTSVVHMLATRSPDQQSGAYVAVERVRATLEGKRGTFVLVHLGIADHGAQSLTLTVAPDTGTGELRGLAGQMKIEIVEGQHHYELDYTLP